MALGLVEADVRVLMVMRWCALERVVIQVLHRLVPIRGRLSISALSGHRRRHVYCAGVDVPVLKMTASLRGGHFVYRHVHSRAIDMPSAMPR